MAYKHRIIKQIMKCILSFLLLTSVTCFSQHGTQVFKMPKLLIPDTAARLYSDGNSNYLIQYIINSPTFFVPAIAIINTSTGQSIEPPRHYYATIRVFKITDHEKIMVGKEVLGYYVKEGCYEDIPRFIVANAIKTQSEIGMNITP